MAYANLVPETDILSLISTFKKITDELFENHGFSCKILRYPFGIYYCSQDILKCLNYKERTKQSHILKKIKSENKFTISELQEKYYSLQCCNRYLIDPNQELIDSFNQEEIKNVYINKPGLYRIVAIAKKKESRYFKDFMYDILFPSLDDHFQYIITKQKTTINELNLRIIHLLKDIEEVLQNNSESKEEIWL